MHARHAGSHSFLAAVRCGTTLMRTVFPQEQSYKAASVILQQAPRPPDQHSEGFHMSNRPGDGSQPSQQGASNPPGGHNFKSNSHAKIQLWSQSRPDNRSDKR